MGSTGHGLYGASRTGNVNTETFGITGAVNFKGKVPPNSGLEQVGNNKITLKVPGERGTNVLFQFKLNKNNSLMTIIGYRNGVPEVKCKVAVDSGNPSLAPLIRDGTKSEKLNANKLRTLFAQSSEVSEMQLGAIADKLLSEKRKKVVQ